MKNFCLNHMLKSVEDEEYAKDLYKKNLKQLQCSWIQLTKSYQKQQISNDEHSGIPQEKVYKMLNQ